MKQLFFSNGEQIPAIGLGTWKSRRSLVKEAVKFALENGCRHIDCARNYANETEVGEALTSVFSERRIKREDVFVTSKLWNNAHRRQDVIPALKQSLKDLKLDYLDLYLIHWPVAFRREIETFPRKDDDYLSLDEVPILETWEAFLEAKRIGLVKHVGVSNFSIRKLEDLRLKTNQIPEMLQVEMHPFLPQKELIKYCQQHSILMTAYSPLGSGDRAHSMKKEKEPSLLNNELILSLSKEKQCTPAQILIKWIEEQNIAVIPKSTTPEHILSNLKSGEIHLSNDDMKRIDNIGTRYRYVDGEFFITSGNPYNNIFDL